MATLRELQDRLKHAAKHGSDHEIQMASLDILDHVVDVLESYADQGLVKLSVHDEHTTRPYLIIKHGRIEYYFYPSMDIDLDVLIQKLEKAKRNREINKYILNGDLPLGWLDKPIYVKDKQKIYVPKQFVGFMVGKEAHRISQISRNLRSKIRVEPKDVENVSYNTRLRLNVKNSFVSLEEAGLTHFK